MKRTQADLTPEEREKRKLVARITTLKSLKYPTPAEQRELAELDARPDGREAFDELLRRAAQPKK